LTASSSTLADLEVTFFHTIVDLVAELPSSKVVTTFIKGGLVSTWRSFADITTEGVADEGVAAEGVAAEGVAAEGVAEAEFVEVVPFGLSIVCPNGPFGLSIVCEFDDGEIEAMATFE
jgi:hypothetical protein